MFDDIRSLIDGFGWLSAQHEQMIFVGNARKA